MSSILWSVECECHIVVDGLYAHILAFNAHIHLRGTGRRKQMRGTHGGVREQLESGFDRVDGEMCPTSNVFR